MADHAARPVRGGLAVAADALSLAAAPTFALLAWFTHAWGGPMGPLCGGGAPMQGMALMYVLMSLFHAPPWLRLARSRRSSIR